MVKVGIDIFQDSATSYASRARALAQGYYPEKHYAHFTSRLYSSESFG